MASFVCTDECGTQQNSMVRRVNSRGYLFIQTKQRFVVMKGENGFLSLWLRRIQKSSEQQEKSSTVKHIWICTYGSTQEVVHLREWAKLSAQSRRYDAVLLTTPRQNSMVWMAW